MKIRPLKNIKNGRNVTVLTNCDVNHEGSSEKMEKQGAVDIFLRSIEKRRLKYTAFVGDGDSTSFGFVKGACSDMYGDDFREFSILPHVIMWQVL